MRGDGHAGSVTGLVLAVAAFFVAMVGTSLPTPLYPLYEERYSFGPLLVTAILAICALGVIGGLILFGNLSDRVGRKPVLRELRRRLRESRRPRCGDCAGVGVLAPGVLVSLLGSRGPI